MELALQVNGEAREVEADPERTLLSVVRNELGLTGTKYGCGEGKCGACTLLVDGEPVQACSMSVGAAAGSHITTIEGLAVAGRLHALQAAFLEKGAFQCGYCTPGMILSAAALLAANPQPTDAEIIRAMQDNICRCGSYLRIVAAIRLAAATLVDGGAAGSFDEVFADAAGADRQADSPTLEEMMAEGLLVAYPCPDLTMAVYGVEGTPPPVEERALTEIGPWVHIAGDGAITVSVGKAEVGQNIRTSLAQIVGEELRVPAPAVRVVMGDTGRTPFDMGTFGSRTTPITGAQVRRAGAVARELLLEVAAATWNRSPADLEIDDGVVRERDGARAASYGELARDRQLLRIADEAAPVTPPEAWRVAGESAAKVDGGAFVTGRHAYASDVALPGMLFGKVLRAPAFQAELESVETQAATALEGVTVVQEGGFVGVTAPDELTAARAIDALRAKWRTTLQVSQPEVFEYFKENPAEAVGHWGAHLSVEGSVAEGLAQADVTLERRYTVDYIAHVPLEPRAAVAVWAGDALTVWAGTQRPFGVRAELATVFALPLQQVRVIAPDTGAGYGGKHAGDAAIEAARLARATGRPVKVAWTRQEEFTWAYFRPAGLIEVSGGVRRDGGLTALEFHNYNSGAAGIEPLYEIANKHIEYHAAQTPLRQGAYRALSTTANTFARESFLDELAAEIGMDALEIRLRNLSDGRLRDVLVAAADAFGWGKPEWRALPPGRGVGLACGYEKGSYVAACVEVEVNRTNGQPKVVRVVEAYDCGPVINPDHVAAQVEGAIIQGLGGALFEGVKFANGRILNPSFAGYRVPRFGDAPVIETVLIERKDVPPVGAGETPIVAVAPAIGSAIFAATGVRLRAMPLAPHGVKRKDEG